MSCEPLTITHLHILFGGLKLLHWKVLVGAIAEQEPTLSQTIIRVDNHEIASRKNVQTDRHGGTFVETMARVRL